MTASTALDYLISTIRHAPDDALLCDLLTRLGALCGSRPDSLALLERFERELRLERGRRNLLAAFAKARRIDGC